MGGVGLAAILIVVIVLYLLPFGGQGQHATVVETTNKVDAHPRPADTWQPATVDMAIYGGGQVRTGADSRARLELPEGIVRLSADTVFTVKESVTRRGRALTTLSLQEGRLWVSVTTNQPHEFTVEAGSAVAAVRDTRFSVAVAAGETLVSVAEGQVVLTAQEQSVTVAADQQTTVKADQPPAPPEPLSDEERTLWATEGEMPEMAPPTSTPTQTPSATPIPSETPTATPTATNTPTPTPVPALSGRVTDAVTGHGIEGARVEAGPAGSARQGMRGWNYSVTTASDGRYTMFGLPAGDYLVRVVATGYAREYWDNVTPSEEATVVTVSAGGTVSGIDLALTAGGSISGHIYQSDGTTPIVGAWVLIRPSRHIRDDGFCATTDAEGAYTVEELPLGDFRVTAEAPSYARLRYYNGAGGAYDWLQAADVTVVPPATIPDVNINLHLGASISGHVYQRDGVTPFANANVNTEEYAPSGPTQEGYDTNANSDGYYILEGLRPVNYVINAAAPGFAHRWYDSKPSSCNADQLTIAEGEALTGIDFTLDIAAPLRGRVYNEAGEPIPGLVVIADFRLCPGQWADIRGADSSGAYELWLGTGDYFIKVWDEVSDYVPELYNDAYRFEDADPVHVEAPGVVSGIDFYLTRAGSISGHVYEADGTTPIPNANVYAFPVAGSHPGNGINTGPDGSYTIVGLPSGQYRVQATVSGHAAQYFDNTPDKASATEVGVNPPADTPGIDFRLRRVSR